ncbi:Cryptochrome-1 [Hondaea fermentalgiana]|uniref:Cryptochrome-1 n=1 Tax=Hondaea fermentalgiana TaxID=2315210 RepID=A0A2R5GAF5_9STRA|nr:Cryptochrome-1 [Hondaea fermentalgiana]|eukprot:GBG27575.1 Cryptochrome-1 [Hondaea fermentalgiana]
MPSAQTKILWLRKTLRIHDNPTLKACMEDASTVLPVYVLDKWHSNPQNVGDVRFEFIMESLRNLDEKFKKCGVDAGVIFVRGEPEKVLPKIWEAVDAKAIGFDTSEEAEKHSQKTDEDVAGLANKADVKVIDEPAHWMHPPGLYERHMNGGEVPTTMSSFETLFSQCGSVREPLSAPKSIPYDKGTADKALDAIRKALDVEDLTVPKSGDNKFYKGLKREQRKLRFPGGEDEALKRLEKVVEKQPDWVASFEKPKTAPTGLEPQTTVLSPYLNAGCLSLRRAWHAVKKAEKDAKGKPTQPPTSLAGQLLWREHWLTIGYFTEEDISKMKGNPLARQIDWDWDNDAKELFAKWEAGETGYPFIDAIMTQLREEGWIHHLARHMVACFLTRGDCFVSWEKGFDVFDRLLIDADWSVNSCNWMWLSCSAFFYQYFRCYSPISFGKKWDPDGDYIRKYVPALKDMPKKYIYEPWKAPREVQEKAKCIIGKDYPERIIEDHTATSKENMNRIKEDYDLSSSTVK